MAACKQRQYSTVQYRENKHLVKEIFLTDSQLKEWQNTKQVEKKEDNFTQEVEGGPDLDELRKEWKVLIFVGLLR